ncbi:MULTISPECIES: DUF6338 family protein [Aeromonas]|uniref:DUF6338 family protein n=1 Tax=Aeromonas TaxID=642 RepID=UPI0009B7F984|nr:DUF6338 family protein [Aeromonas hydrophila]
MSLELFEINKLMMFIAFVMPGFLAIKAYDVFVVVAAPKSSSEKLIDAATYSCINYMIWLPFVYMVESSQLKIVHMWLYVLFYILVLFISPVVITYLWVKVRTRYLNRHPTEKPWDYVFSLRKSYWVIVTLKSGERIGGLYKDKSFVSSSPASEQIYLEESWVINNDGGFERVKSNSEGIMILSSEILYLEFFKH